MKTTNYTDIAQRYEKNPIRHHVDKEPLVGGCSDDGPVRILDIACGTGIWLASQIEYYNSSRIEWYGIDASEAMIAVARAKPLRANLSLADSAALPFPDGHFSFASCNFAFHHFTDKPSALREARRVLKPGANLVVTNMCPEHMADSYVARFFPESVAIDRERFLTNAEFHELMVQCGFRPSIDVKVSVREVEMAPLLREAENRDVSQLTLISEKAYQQGLSAMRSHGPTYVDTFALLRAVGVAV